MATLIVVRQRRRTATLFWIELFWTCHCTNCYRFPQKTMSGSLTHALHAPSQLVGPLKYLAVSRSSCMPKQALSLDGTCYFRVPRLRVPCCNVVKLGYQEFVCHMGIRVCCTLPHATGCNAMCATSMHTCRCMTHL